MTALRERGYDDRGLGLDWTLFVLRGCLEEKLRSLYKQALGGELCVNSQSEKE